MASTIYGGAATTMTNVVNVNGNVTFGGTAAANNLTLNNVVNLGSVARTLTVTYPSVTTALAGGILGTGGLTKAGDGVLNLGVGADYSGADHDQRRQGHGGRRVSHEFAPIRSPPMRCSTSTRKPSLSARWVAPVW